MRAHFLGSVTDNAGNLLAGTVVTIYQNGTTTLITNPIYPDGTSGATLPNPFTTTTGIVSFYLDNPQRVDLAISAPGQTPYTQADIDVNASGTTSVTLTFPGTGSHSTQVGLNAVASGTQSAAYGDSSSATGTTSTALGQNAQASGASSLAVGQAAKASANQAIAEGAGTIASAAQATALGYLANANATGATAIGSNSSAAGVNSTAIGINATAALPHQVVLGTLAEDILVAGGAVWSETASPATLTNGNTISFASPGQAVVTCTAAGNITGLILAPATVAGQILTVVNESSFTLTFAISGTSNVADGTSDVIAALTARIFIWDSNTLLWYRVA